MYRKLRAQKTAYLTDKIVRGVRRDEANTGRSHSLDIFKLQDASVSGSATSVRELSRALIKFDLSPLRALTSSLLDFTHPSFRAEIHMRDVYGGQTVPSNFTLVAYPMSRSWDEGIGRDVAYFSDIDTANWITASWAGSAPSLWNSQGAGQGGLLGSSDIDYISSGSVGQGIEPLVASQSFTDGTEDLRLDVTRIVSATLAGRVPDEGFRIALSQSHEENGKTYFVKRFGSRHTFDPYLRPRLLCRWQSAVQSHENDFNWDLSGSLFLFNYDRGGLSDIRSGSSATQITGSSCMTLKLVATGSTSLVSRSFSVSQHTIGSLVMSGVYSSSFALLSNESDFVTMYHASASVTFHPYWKSLDGTVTFVTGSSFSVRRPPRLGFQRSPRNLTVNITNMQAEYRANESTRMRLFVFDKDKLDAPSRVPLALTSEMFYDMHFSIRDKQTGTIAIPFDPTGKSTLISCDAAGMFFDLFMEDLEVNRPYAVDFLIRQNGNDQIYRDVGRQFVVTPVQ